MSFHKNLIPDHAMKKILTLSTGIVFLVTILIPGGCKSDKNDKEVSNKVVIYLRSAENTGGKHLYLYDSNGQAAFDSLTTVVERGDDIFWELERNSGIRKVTEIYPSEKRGTVFTENPKKIFLSKTFKYTIPNDAQRGTEEKYTIDFVLKDGTKDTLDPYIRIKE